MFKKNFKIEWKENFNETLKVYQHLLYYLGRVLAVFVFGPFLIYKGTKYNDIYLTLFGILLILWDGSKLVIQAYYDDYSY
jgi:hypothetical protein